MEISSLGNPLWQTTWMFLFTQNHKRTLVLIQVHLWEWDQSQELSVVLPAVLRVRQGPIISELFYNYGLRVPVETNSTELDSLSTSLSQPKLIVTPSAPELRLCVDDFCRVCVRVCVYNRSPWGVIM